VELVELAGPSRAETFEAWATGAAAIMTATAIFIGGVWALWRYVLPAPLALMWEIETASCWIRRVQAQRFMYSVEVKLTNASKNVYRIAGASFGMFMPGEIASFEKLRKFDPRDYGAAELDETCTPGRSRRFFVSEIKGRLHHQVVVLGEIRFSGRKYLGIFRWRHERLRIRRFIPVDVESLALYTDSSKEETSNQRSPSTPGGFRIGSPARRGVPTGSYPG
jgi:hypothetical protein